MSTTSQYRETLQRIAQNAHNVAQMIGPLPPQIGLQPTPSPHHHLTIPLPEPITSTFVARGFGLDVAEEFNKVFVDQVLSLKLLYEEKHRQAVKSWLDGGSFRVHDMDAFISATHSAYLYRFNEDIKRWRAKVDEISRRRRPSGRERVPSANAKNVRMNYTTEQRPTFKNETVPLLEKAFVSNAYPSRVDKENLAEETGMEYKQINIWFQNRRARSKKEGISLHRTATFATQLHASRSDSPELESHFTVAYEARPTHPVQESSTRDPSDRSTDFFPLTARPAHTFPTTYPPLSVEDSFPSRSGVGSFQTCWLRVCTAKPIRRPLVDMEQLTIQLASLSLSSDVSDKSITIPLPSFTLVVPRAPLPALIRTATTSSRALAVATFVSASGSSPSSKASRKLFRAHPTNLPLSTEHHGSSRLSSSVAGSWPIPILYPHASASGQSRRSGARSPSPPNSSRSPSLASASSRSVSSSRSVASSIGPITPSTSPRVEALLLAKDIPSPCTSAHVHRSSSISDGVHMFSSFR